MLAGESFKPAVFELIDELQFAATKEDLTHAIEGEPTLCGDDRVDALFGGLGEWIAVRARLPTPGWTRGNDRFLDHFWFLSDTPGFRALAVAQSPAAFRRRGIFVAEGFLDRC